MQSTCPSCGAETFAGARFCRRCGGPLRHAGDDGTGEVSPQAATVPLRDEPRPTDALEETRPSAQTSRVGRAELERMLREQSAPDPEATITDSARGAIADEPHPRRDTTPDADEHEATILTPPGSGPRRTRIVIGEARDEELTISVPRSAATHETLAHAARETSAQLPSSAGGGSPSRVTSAQAAAPTEAQPAAPPHVAPPKAAAPRRRWPLYVALGLALSLFGVAAAWLAARFWLKPAPEVTQGATPPPAPDPSQLFEEKLAEAEALLAQGNLEGAVAALRAANQILPSNAKAHRRLGELLLESGARREALEEFRAVTRHDPNDFSAWRQLAAALGGEGLHREAAESYRRVVELVGDSADPNDLLAYADALRQSGRVEEARTVYQRLASLPAAEVAGLAGLARQRLAELAPPDTLPSPGPNGERPGDSALTAAGETASVTNPQPAPPAPTPAPTPQPAQPTPQPPAPSRPAAASPAEHYQRGVELWSSNRAAAFGEFQSAAGGGNVDANYYLGLYYAEGKEPRSLNRAALLAALRHFQLAQRGQHAAQARRYAQQLEKEVDRTRR